MGRVERDPGGSAHILVKRISGTIEAEDQGALPVGCVGVRLPHALVRIRGRGAGEASCRVRMEGVSFSGEGERNGKGRRHVGEGREERP